MLNGKSGISKSTRERVAALLEEHGFTVKTPSKEERASQRIIQFIRYCDTGDLVERNDDFITQVMEGAESVLRQERYMMSVVNVGNDGLADVLQNSSLENVAGIIFLGTEFDASQYNLLAKLKAPLVAVDNCFRKHPINAVDMDNIGGAQAAIHHLYELGHREIGYLKSTNETESLKERSLGFHHALNTLGLKPFSTVLLSPRVASADEEMCVYLDGSPQLPTAFFADNDIIAVGAMRALLQKGVRIPEDVSLIGFDDSLIASIVVPSLTTMYIYKREMGICAARRLIDMINHQDSFISKSSVCVDLIKRSTTTAPREKAFVWDE